jgi:hypothetical protein
MVRGFDSPGRDNAPVHYGAFLYFGIVPNKGSDYILPNR